jgi:uncharacterized protein (TIGR03067 family)
MHFLSFCAACALMLANHLVALAADDKPLDGEWTITAMEFRGLMLPEDDLKEAVIRFAEGKLKATVGDDVTNVSNFRLDTTAKPPTIDFDVLEGPDKGQKQPGIYELKDDVLTLCINTGGDERPTEFRAPEDKKYALITLQRKK